MKTSIIYEDKDILVVQKPAGLATQTARVGQEDVVSELKCYLSARDKECGQGNAAGKGKRGTRRGHKTDENYLGVVHRLDQPVEGLLVFAKNKAAAGALTRQLSEGTFNKQYYAVLCGYAYECESPAEGKYFLEGRQTRESRHCLTKEGELADYLLKEENRARVVTGQQEKYPAARRAVLQYRILQEVSAPEPLALAEIHIDTGRFHQIRAQMSHAGMPLLGDAKYGNAQIQELGRRLAVGNVALCAYSLTLKHPVTGKCLSFRIKPVGKAFSYFTENNF